MNIKQYLIHLANMQRKHKICLIILTITFVLTFINITVAYNDIYLVDNYRAPSLDIIEDLSDLQQDIFVGDIYAPTRGHDHIIFIESSCAISTYGRDSASTQLILSPMQACAVESAARTNPNTTVYLFYSCPLDSGSLSRSSRLVQRVFALPNVRYWHQSMESMFGGTPLQEFYRSNSMWWSFYQTSHASDVIRILLLWKYGGAYLDLDFVVRRPLAELGSNYATAEDGDSLNSAAMRLSTSGIGKEVAALCLEEIRTNFRGFRFGYNGPGLMTRVMQKICGESKIIRMTKGLCRGFVVHPPPVFYPLHWADWKLLFDAFSSDATMEKIRPSHAVHLWNSLKKFSFGIHLDRGSRQPIALMQQEFCPVSYQYNPKPSPSSTFRNSGSVFCVLVWSLFVLQLTI